MIGAREPMVRRRVVRLATAVAAAAVLAYALALAGQLVFDDVHSVAANPAVHDLGNFGRFWTDPSAFSGGAARMYRPVLLSSLALNIALQPAAWSLKAGNVLLHAAVAALLFSWLWRLSRRAVPCALAAAWFAVHPLCSEAVNLVSARSELLSTLGILIGLHAHLSWQRRGRSILALAGVAIGAALACGSKETGVALPFLCLAQAACQRHRRIASRDCVRAALGVLPAIAVVAAYLVARKLLLGEATVTLLGRTGEDPLAGYSRTLAMQLATMGGVLPAAVLQALVPFELSLDPPVRFHATPLAPLALLGWTAMASLTVTACWPGPSSRLRRLGALFAWLVAAPWIVVPLNMPFAEHRMYGPLVGFAAVAAALLPRLRPLFVQRPGLRRAAAPVALALLGCFALVSADRSYAYRDERLLWRIELARQPHSFRAAWGLGTSTLRAGDARGAVEPLARAHALYPRHYDTLRNYCEALLSVADADADPHRSLVVAGRLLDLGPADPWVRTLVAQANLQAGRVLGEPERFAAAERIALSCLEIAPPKGYVFQLAAQARRGLGDLEGALAHLDDSLARGLAPVGVRLDRAALLLALGRAAAARRELQRAQREAPLDPMVLRAVRDFAAPPR